MQTLSEYALCRWFLGDCIKSKKYIDGIGWIDKEKKARELKKIASLLLTVVHVQIFQNLGKRRHCGQQYNVFDQEAVELCLLHSKETSITVLMTGRGF